MEVINHTKEENNCLSTAENARNTAAMMISETLESRLKTACCKTTLADATSVAEVESYLDDHCSMISKLVALAGIRDPFESLDELKQFAEVDLGIKLKVVENANW